MFLQCMTLSDCCIVLSEDLNCFNICFRSYRWACGQENEHINCQVLNPFIDEAKLQFARYAGTDDGTETRVIS